MKFGITRIAALIVTSCAAIFAASSAHAAPYFTTALDPSSFTLEIVVFGEDEEGNPTEQVLATIGPLGANGTVDADVALDGLGDGTLTFNSGTLTLDDSSGTLDLQDLGTVDLELDNVGLSITSTGVPVTGNLWNLDVNAPTAFDISLNQGKLVLDNPTGFLAAVLTDVPLIVDLEAEPLSVPLDQLLGFNVGGTASALDITLDVPGALLDLGEQFGLGAGVLFGRITVDVNLTAVPEPSSIALMGLGLVGLGAVGYRRIRK